jgi:Na+/H+ antiporter NhaD/arsenite permease-like protein
MRISRTAAISLAALLSVLAVTASSALAPVLMPAQVEPMHQIAAGVIFATSYVALAIGGIPGMAIDRAGVALVGASLMVASRAMSLEAAYKAVDLDTLTLLLGMMIVVASLRLSGFFALATAWVTRRAHRPLLLLTAVALVAGVFSAFLVNDAICLVLAPLVVDLTLAARREPVPYLLAVAMASNIGSTATITGNPQNILIGSFSRIPYVQFAGALAPIAVVGLAVAVGIIVLMHRSEFAGGGAVATPDRHPRVNKPLVRRAVAAVGILIALFFAGVAPAGAAIVIGALLLLTRRVRSGRIYAEIDWSLLLMFAGLFIIVAGAEQRLLTHRVIAEVAALHLGRAPMLSAVTAVLSNLVSNVPAVLVLRPFVEALHDRDHAWLVVAMASTLAGNFTLLGSIANLIVAEKAGQRGIAVGFWTYFRVGAPVTIITLVLGTLWLMR